MTATLTYLIKSPHIPSKKKRAHIWLGDDTACRQYSTGGIRAKQQTGRVLWTETEVIDT